MNWEITPLGVNPILAMKRIWHSILCTALHIDGVGELALGKLSVWEDEHAPHD